MAGVLGNDQTRLWALQKIPGYNIPVPGVDGLKLKLIAPKGEIVGGGAGYKGKIVGVEGQYGPYKLPNNTQVPEYELMLTIDAAEVIRRIVR